jgi:hypothetical protein
MYTNVKTVVIELLPSKTYVSSVVIIELLQSKNKNTSITEIEFFY